MPVRPLDPHNGAVGTPASSLTAQRWLLAALLGVVLVSALLLVGLRGGGPRGRAARAEPTPAAPSLAGPEARSEEAAPPAAPGASGALERTAAASVPVEPATSTVDFDPATALGRIVARGAPVAGVEVRLYPGHLYRHERGAPLATTTSDEEGRFRVPGLEPHRRLTACLQHPDFRPEEESLYPGHEEELELDPTVTVRGRVRSSTGAPLAGVEVALDCWHLADGVFRAQVASTSDAEGRWALSWAEPGIESFLVLRPGYLPETHEFQVMEEGSAEYEIVLGGVPELALELYLLEDGSTLAEAEVLSDEKRVRTDARGMLALPLTAGLLAEGSLRVALSLPGGPVTQGRVALGEGRPRVVRLPLARGATVTGRVVDGDAAPIEGAQVRLSGGGRLPPGLGFPDGFWLNPPRGGSRTGPDGRFELAGLAPREGQVSVRADHPDHPPGSSEPFDLAGLGARHETEVRLERGVTIRGHTRVDGQPTALEVHWNGERSGGSTRSNDQGDYLLRGLPAGEITLRPRLEHEDEDLPRAEDQTLVAADGAELDVDLDLDGGLQWIRGRVVDTLGAPVAGADVRAWPSESEVVTIQNGDDWRIEDLRTRSRADGGFELAVPDLAGLVLDLSARSGPAGTSVTGVRPGTDELELVLPALGPLELRVVDSLRREPVLGFQLYWRTSEDGRFARASRQRSSPGPDGTFVAELPMGTLDLAVSARQLGYVPARREGVRVPGRPGAPVELELEPGVELVLEIEVAPETPGLASQLARARTAIATEEQWSGRERDGDLYHQEVRSAQALRPGADGIVRLGGLASGRYRFVNVPRGLVFRPRTFELPPVTSHRQRVTLEREPEKKPGRNNGGEGD
ncbi:MAG TPA: carboxypeptidase regulatory-like domain-containing protein [Planctomycetota bacterium]